MPTGIGTATLIAGLAGAGASVAGSALASRGNTKAAETAANAATEAARVQAESDAKALAQAKEIYEQQRADQGPYRETGYSSLNALNYGLGLPAVSYQAPAAAKAADATPTNLPSSTLNGQTFPGAPQVPQSTLSTVNTVAQSKGTAGKLAQNTLDRINQAQTLVNEKYAGSGQTTKVKGPNGVIYLVPNDKVEAAKQAGGTVVL